MRLLILGGAGFIGSRVARVFHEHEVYVFHRGENCKATSGDKHLHGAISNLPSFRTEFSKISPEVVLDMTSRNDSDARLVMDSLAGIVKRIVVVSSVSVYRSFGVMLGIEKAPIDNTPVTEDAPLRTKMFPYRHVKAPISKDGRTSLNDYDKIAVERAYLSQSLIDCVIIRLPMVYGPEDPDKRLGTYINQMIANRDAIYLKRTVARWRNSRAFVENVAQAISSIILYGKPGRAYNYAEPENYMEATWVYRLSRVVGWSGEIRLVDDHATYGYPAIGELPRETNFAQHLVMDSTRIRSELGFVESISGGEALRLTIGC